MDILRGLIAYAISAVTGKPRPLSTNASDELLVSLASSVATQDCNIIEVNGVAVPATSVAGTLPVETDHRQVAGSTIATTAISGTFPQEGTSADNAIHDGSYPTNVGGKVAAADPTYHDGDKGELSIDLAGRLRANDNVTQIGGNTVAGVGVNGGFFVAGDVADGATASASYPLKMGAVSEFVPAGTGIANGEITHLITDFQRYLRTVSKAFSELTSADQVENLNTAATDHGYFLIANETNIPQPATQYFPNSSGIVIGSRVNITILLLLEDITSVGFEFTNDPTLTSWEDITASVMDPNTGAYLYAPSHWTEPGSATPIVMAMHVRGLNAGSFRLAVVGSAIANTFAAHGYSGAL